MNLIRPFGLLPLSVVPGKVWSVDCDIKTWEIYCILYMEPRIGDKWITFSEAYRLRWLERSTQDSNGKYWLKDSKAIRTPLHIYCRDNGYFPYFLSTEITFPELLDHYF